MVPEISDSGSLHGATIMEHKGAVVNVEGRDVLEVGRFLPEMGGGITERIADYGLRRSGDWSMPPQKTH